jgi:DNA polymerase-1
MSGQLIFGWSSHIYAEELLGGMFADAGLSLPPMVTPDSYDRDCQGPSIVFGASAHEQLFSRQMIPGERGWSTWVSPTQRYVTTHTVQHVFDHPDLFFDLWADVILPFKYPISKQPTTGVTHTLVPGSVEMIERLNDHISQHPGLYAFDIETAGFAPMKDDILCISIGVTDEHSFVLPPNCWSTQALLAATQDLLMNPAATWVAHNGKFDVRFIRHQLGVVMPLHHDTMLLHYILDERLGTHGLKQLCSTRLALPDYEADLRAHLRRKSDSYATIPPRILYRYAGCDTCFTLRLYHRLMLEMGDNPFKDNLMAAYAFLMEASNALGDIETVGFVIDQEALEEASTYLAAQCEQLANDLTAFSGRLSFNPRSPKQVASYLYDQQSYREVKLFRNHKPRSTSAEALRKLAFEYPDDPLLPKLIEYRETQKILSTYVTPIEKAIDPDGRLRADFRLHGTVTGRLACAKPNLQNIPRPSKNKSAKLIRNMFTVASGNTIVGADYSQAELRVAAIFAQEERMRAVWESGTDLHTQTCIDLFGPDWQPEHRMIAKMLNFGVVYGRTAGSIAVERNISFAEATQIMDKFFETKPRLALWLANTRAEALEKGYLVTPTGRMRRFGLITEQSKWRVQNQAANFRISSTASDLCLRAAIDMHNWCKHTGLGWVLLLVHDSIYVECRRENAKTVEQALTGFMLKASETILQTDWIPMAAEAHHADRWGDL